jgi:predicted peptidase
MTRGGQTAHPLPNPSGLGYLEYLPVGYGTGTRFPLIVFLHGSGERGDGSHRELARVFAHGPPKLLAAGAELPALVISPQLADERRWTAAVTTPFVDHVLGAYDVDPDRIYITGLSLGGEGAWVYGRSHPERIAALVPVCGPRSGAGYGVLRDVPIWAFHTGAEPIVPIDTSLDILTEVTGVRPEHEAGHTGYFDGTRWSWRPGEAAPRAGEGRAFTVYPGTSHDAWTPAYDNPDLWRWLFAQRRAGPGRAT